jgi:fluoride ion exporter CrcB/FEX
MISKFNNLVTRIFTTSLGFSIFVFIGGLIGGSGRVIGRFLFKQEPLQFDHIVFGIMGALLVAVFAYAFHKITIERKSKMQ